MISGGPITTYLDELRQRLPYPAPRFLRETREHLVDTATKLRSAGEDPEDAERHAIERFGPVDDVIAAVRKEGSPMMSSRVLRWILPLAGLLTLPAFIFIATNGIEHLAGSDGGEGIFGAALDKWQTPVNGLLIFGPMVALALLVLASTRIDLGRSDGGLSATIDMRLTRGAMFAVIAIGVAVAAILIYGITENLDGPGSFFGGDWSCTVPRFSNKMTCVQL